MDKLILLIVAPFVIILEMILDLFGGGKKK